MTCIAWTTSNNSSGSMSLKAAAEHLGVHYMTAYRYVRTGRLPARTVGGFWKVEAEDLRRFQAAPADLEPHRETRERRIQQMIHCLVAGDEFGADSVADATLASGFEVAELYLEIVSPALRRIGEQWASGELSVADEHRASTCAQRLLGRIGPRFVTRGRRRGIVLLGAPAGDHHAIPVTMIADLLRHEGVEAIDLGADVPTEALLHAAHKADGLGVIAICATVSGTELSIRASITAAHDELDGVVVALGGAAVTEEVARDLGADYFSGNNGVAALAALVALAIAARPGPLTNG